ncbi:uncharacterized protein LOC126366396 [Pectinophora gossypiella]|uniref:uncharacterized protein LOC126366396 n=1 Tax=Pectinophora gossypiella TaxID=13191 RepID=UPI00214E3FD1|nr:uncharacterized protein LOC126366396 [Pectinophora gossypiella]
MYKLIGLLSPNQMVRRSSSMLGRYQRYRCYADTPHTDLTSKQVVVQGNENEQRVRVRRARPSDVPRVLRFVREHARWAWPSLVSAPVAPTAASQLVLADYVSRALAQGHTMVAEQVGSRRGWLQVRGLALGAAVCPWDAAVLERWARCMRCARSRRLMHFTAHCLRAPGLHDKYRVHNILQVIMILPPDAQHNPEIVQVLARSAIQRGREVGYPLLRFDVTNEHVAQALEGLQLTKEWHMSYDIMPESMQEKESGASPAAAVPNPKERKMSFITVYTSFTSPENVKVS